MISGLLLKLVLGARKGVSEGWMQAAESVLEGIEGAFQSGEAVLDVAEGGGAAEDVAVVGGGFGQGIIAEAAHVVVHGFGEIIHAAFDGDACLAEFAAAGVLDFAVVALKRLDGAVEGGVGGFCTVFL
jgi:hypothetical protein